MSRSKKLIVTAIVLLACTGVALHLTMHYAHHKSHGLAMSPQKLASYAASTAFPGNATPENALQSLGWAASKGDLKLLRDGMTPGFQKMVDAPNMEAQVIHEAGKLVGSKILNKEVLSNEQVLLYVQTDGTDQPRKFLMQKIEDEWKFAAHLP